MMFNLQAVASTSVADLEVGGRDDVDTTETTTDKGITPCKILISIAILMDLNNSSTVKPFNFASFNVNAEMALEPGNCPPPISLRTKLGTISAVSSSAAAHHKKGFFACHKPINGYRDITFHI